MISQDLLVSILAAVCHLSEPGYTEQSKLACIDQYVNCSIERSGTTKPETLQKCIEVNGNILNYDY